MDHYGNNNNNISSSSSYSSLPSIAPQQLQHNASGLTPHTLPPLQPQHNAMSMHSMYGQAMSAPHTPTTSTPNTPGSVGNGGFQQMNSQPPRGYHLQGNPYQQNMPYGNSSMMQQTSSAMSHPQSIAPAPAPNRLVPLRPMTSAPPGQHGLHSQMQPGMSSAYQQALAHDNEPPTHVVGSQGRRGILPSAPGRPAVTATGPGSAKNTVIPAKDADGKFPCPHCTKTYLHAKHLKRHLLRHTGDRPYMCVLCKDTFSRSDILKRHFQKCSIRRGNPLGATHLSHAQAHLKKAHPGPHKSGSSSTDGPMNGVPGMATEPVHNHPFGVIPITDSASNITDDHSVQGQLSRANSLNRMSAAGGRDRRSLTGPAHGGSSRSSFDGYGNSNEIPTSMPSGMNSHLANAFNMQNGQSGAGFAGNYDFGSQSNGNGNGLAGHPNGDMSTTMAGGRNNGMSPMFGGPANGQQQDWSMFSSGAQDGFISSFNPSLGQNQVQNPIKGEPSAKHPTNPVHPGIAMA